MILSLLLSVSALSAVDVRLPAESAFASDWDRTDFSHALWDKVLSDHVNEAGLVNYSAVRLDERFREYLFRLAKTDPSGLPSSSAKKAFWINAYNALAVYGAIRVMPAEPKAQREFSVLSFELPGYDKGKAFFAGQRFLVGGGRYVLDEIEKKILFRQWADVEPRDMRRYARVAPDAGDPRLHFALVCCAKGCPALSRTAYTAADVESQLENAAKRFFNDPHQSQFDLEKKVWRVSPLLDWYRSDFSNAGYEPKARDLFEFASRYVDDAGLAKSLKSSGWRIEYGSYDWRLNIR